MGKRNHPPTAPKVFVSYAWTSARIRTWVRKFSSCLRHDGIDVCLDRWDIQSGNDVGKSMAKAIEGSRFVLLICTPDYRRRADNDEGSVGFETSLMMTDVRMNKPADKYIVVVRQGTPKTSIPLWIGGALRFDLRTALDGADYSNSEYRGLLHALKLRQTKPRMGLAREEAALPVEPVTLPPNAIAKLISPSSESIVTRLTECIVITENIPDELDRWLLVYGAGSRLWYPTKVDLRDARWNFKTIVGSVECAGAEFRVALFITNRKGSEYLESRLYGVSILPPGVLDGVTVIRA